MQILHVTDLTESPWKNGGGITRNIAKGVTSYGVAWTLSRADVVEDGDFSNFAGMQRILTVVTDGAMQLTSPTTTFNAMQWTPVHFDGGLPISSRLTNGPLTNFNLMFDPTHCSAEVVTLRGPVEKGICSPSKGLIAYHVLSGAPMAGVSALNVGDTVFAGSSDQTLCLNEGDAVLEIRLRYLAQTDAIKLCIADR